MVSNIKAKSEYVNEVCYRFTDRDARVTEYYNDEGDMIESRPATADELQPTLFQPRIVVGEQTKTGTNN